MRACSYTCIPSRHCDKIKTERVPCCPHAALNDAEVALRYINIFSVADAPMPNPLPSPKPDPLTNTAKNYTYADGVPLVGAMPDGSTTDGSEEMTYGSEESSNKGLSPTVLAIIGGCVGGAVLVFVGERGTALLGCLAVLGCALFGVALWQKER